MTIFEYRKENFSDLCLLINALNDYVISVDTQKIINGFSSMSDVENYAYQTINDTNERNGFIYMAEEDGQIIGFIQGIIDENTKDGVHKKSHYLGLDGWICELFIKSEYRGRGFGKALIEKGCQYFINNNCKKVRLVALSDNRKTIGIYKKLGFNARDLEMSKEL